MNAHSFIRVHRSLPIRRTAVYKVANQIKRKFIALIEAAGWEVIAVEVEGAEPFSISKREREFALDMFALPE